MPQRLEEYLNFKEELRIENGLVLKGHLLVIPSSLRPQMPQLIYQGHKGAEKCLLKANESSFWPGISRNIKELTTKCPACMQVSKQRPKVEQNHSVPSFPWQKLECDLFDYLGQAHSTFWLQTITASIPS